MFHPRQGIHRKHDSKWWWQTGLVSHTDSRLQMCNLCELFFILNLITPVLLCMCRFQQSSLNQNAFFIYHSIVHSVNVCNGVIFFQPGWHGEIWKLTIAFNKRPVWVGLRGDVAPSNAASRGLRESRDGGSFSWNYFSFFLSQLLL